MSSQTNAPMIRQLIFLFLAIPLCLTAQSSWITVTEDIPLPDRFRESDGTIRGSRLFQLDDKVVLTVSSPTGKYAMISSLDGLTWDIFPGAVDGNRFNVSTRLQTRRRFSSLDPVADLRLQIPVGQTSRLEVTYRDPTGTFLAKGYPGEPFEIPSPGATRTSAETSEALEIIQAYFINYPDLPNGQITNLGLINDTIITQIGGSRRGNLYAWCGDCGSLELQGIWRSLSGQSFADTRPQKMAGGSTRGFILEDPFESTVIEVRERTFGVRQSVGAGPNDTLNDIASHSDTFVIVGADHDFTTNTNKGLVIRKVETQDWQTIPVPGSSEFLSISHGSLGWIATTADGNVWSSPDGTEWAMAGSSPMPLVQVAEITGRWIATTEQGTVYSSNDLSDWKQQLDILSGIRGIAAIGTQYLTYGQKGFLRSPLTNDEFQNYQEWIEFHGVGDELSAPEASAAGDNFSNLFRYLARLAPFESAEGAFSQTHFHRDPESGEDFLAIQVRTRPLPDGALLMVEQSSSLDFDGTPAVEIGTPINESDQTVTRHYRTSQAVSSSKEQFLRVRVTPSPE